MRAVSHTSEGLLGGVLWQPRVLRTLESHHLVAWSPEGARRNRFAAGLQRFLGAQHETEVCVLHGRSIVNLDHLCHQLERLIAAPWGLERRLDGPRSLTELLRQNESLPGQRPARFRYLVWNDADVLLRAEPECFGRVVDAVIGVSAEAEFAGEDAVLVQRGVFLGGSALADYAQDRAGQFRCWAADGSAEPFWQMVTGLTRPPVVTRPVDLLIDPRPRLRA